MQQNFESNLPALITEEAEYTVINNQLINSENKTPKYYDYALDRDLIISDIESRISSRPESEFTKFIIERIINWEDKIMQGSSHLNMREELSKGYNNLRSLGLGRNLNASSKLHETIDQDSLKSTRLLKELKMEYPMYKIIRLSDLDDLKKEFEILELDKKYLKAEVPPSNVNDLVIFRVKKHHIYNISLNNFYPHILAIKTNSSYSKIWDWAKVKLTDYKFINFIKNLTSHNPEIPKYINSDNYDLIFEEIIDFSKELSKFYFEYINNVKQEIYSDFNEYDKKRVKNQDVPQYSNYSNSDLYYRALNEHNLNINMNNDNIVISNFQTLNLSYGWNNITAELNSILFKVKEFNNIINQFPNILNNIESFINQFESRNELLPAQDNIRILGTPKEWDLERYNKDLEEQLKREQAKKEKREEKYRSEYNEKEIIYQIIENEAHSRSLAYRKDFNKSMTQKIRYEMVEALTQELKEKYSISDDKYFKNLNLRLKKLTDDPLIIQPFSGEYSEFGALITAWGDTAWDRFVFNKFRQAELN